MADLVLPALAQLDPVRDEHAWNFPNVHGRPVHVRMRAWPTKEGGYLVIATDLMLAGGLVNMAESLCRAAAAEFGALVAVVRHFPAWTMLAHEQDVFDLLVLDGDGHAHAHRCTEEILDLLGTSVLGFPGDALSDAPEEGSRAVPAQSVQMARLVAAALRLEQHRHGTVMDQDLTSVSQLRLGIAGLERLGKFLAETVVDENDTPAGEKRERKLAKIAEVLHEQAWELTYLCDELEAEARNGA
ncbi:MULTISPECIES: hypothetical protein [Streptomyces]|uniref:hypothetical protein n=1 Tax=Streptomyces TaxID=1883 RepID=UPI002F91EDF9